MKFYKKKWGGGRGRWVSLNLIFQDLIFQDLFILCQEIPPKKVKKPIRKPFLRMISQGKQAYLLPKYLLN